VRPSARQMAMRATLAMWYAIATCIVILPAPVCAIVARPDAEHAPLGAFVDTSNSFQLPKNMLRRLKNDQHDVPPNEAQRLRTALHHGNLGQTVALENATTKNSHIIKQQVIQKLSKHKHHGRQLPVNRETAECGKRLAASTLGLRRGADSAKLFGSGFNELLHAELHRRGKASLLQASSPEEKEEEEMVVSLAKPGAGANQTIKSEGASQMGKVEGLEPYVSVFKDGFFSVGCFMDKMVRDYDKFGNEKDRYHDMAKFNNVSIVSYNELVLKEKQEKMTPRTCFEFCRTIDSMVFFGLQNGRNCYCMPYYIASAELGGGEDSCGMSCPGDANQNCGGKHKSSIYEMHTCGARGAMLTELSGSASQSLSAFYAAAIYSRELSKHLQASGALIEEVAGIGGDPDAAELGMEAKMFAGEVNRALLNDGDCIDQYNVLLTTYQDSEQIALLDMKVASNLQKADDSLMAMERLVPEVDGCAFRANEFIRQGYPVYQDALEAESEEALQAVEEEYSNAVTLFYPLMYVIENKDSPKPSTCAGKLVGKPMIGTFGQCAEACYNMEKPAKCAAFQFFHLGGSEAGHGGSQDTMMPLCFMFEEVKKVTVYNCNMTDDIVKEEQARLKEAAELLQLNLTSTVNAARSLRAVSSEPEEANREDSSEEDEEPVRIQAANCDNVVQALLYTSMTCEELFGTEHSVLETCATACGRGSGGGRDKAALFASVCMSNFAEIRSATAELKQGNKSVCFAGARNREIGSDTAGAIINFLPHDEHGVILSGDATLSGTTVMEPIIWSHADASDL